jgi:hypothetical protein
MRTLIATLSVSLTVTIVAFGLSAGQAQAGFCQYQYTLRRTLRLEGDQD